MGISTQLTLVAIMLILAFDIVQAAPGDLDPAFGNGSGIVRDAMADAGGQGRAVVIDANGRIVVAGTTYPLSPISGDFGLLRLNADGSLDASFGSGGRAIHNAVTFPNGSTSSEEGYGLVLQSDGKLVMAGASFISGPGNDFAALRVDSEGNIDTGFGNSGNGWMTTARPDTDVALAMVMDAAGGFLLAGYVAGSGLDAAGLRLDLLGAPDLGFGSAGFLVGSSDTTSFETVVVQSDGWSVFGGSAEAGGGESLNQPNGGSSVGIVQRFDVNGDVDLGFASDGRAELTGLLDKVGDLKVLADGRILVGGFRSIDAALVRLNADGTLDASFGSGGSLAVDSASLGLGQMFLQALTLDSQGRILACGHGGGSVDGFEIFVMRSTADGQLDSAFGNAGLSLIDAAGDLRCEDIAVQPDGAILIAGSDRGTAATTDDQYLVARLQGGPPVCDQIFAHDFDGPDAQTCT